MPCARPFLDSLQEFGAGELGRRGGLEAETARREHVLDMRQALAREVTLRSKQQAGQSPLSTVHLIMSQRKYVIMWIKIYNYEYSKRFSISRYFPISFVYCDCSIN